MSKVHSHLVRAMIVVCGYKEKTDRQRLKKSEGVGEDGNSVLIVCDRDLTMTRQSTGF
jgi:hypothetical protein